MMKTASGSASQVEHDRRVVCVFAGLLGLQVYMTAGVSVAAVAAVVFLPVWFRDVVKVLMVQAYVVGAALAVLSGLCLTFFFAGPHSFNLISLVTTMNIFLGGVVVSLALLYCLLTVGFNRTLLSYGCGGVAAFLLSPEAWQGNFWKYSLSAPVTVLFLAASSRNRIAQIGVALGLIAIDVIFAYRSHAALLAVACLAVLASALSPSGAKTRAAGTGMLIMLIGVGFLVYELGTSAALSGRLGEQIQERSSRQVELAGSLIEGGRPEWAGTFALMSYNPGGFGAGVIPLAVDSTALKEGLRTVNVGIGGNYVNQYMLGGGFKLHSVVADLWVNLGVIGLLFGLYCGVALALLLGRSLSEARPELVKVFIILFGLWCLAFGPLSSNWPDVCLAVAASLAHLILQGRIEPKVSRSRHSAN